MSNQTTNKTIKFAHLADIHLGGWRERKLRKLNLTAFETAIEKIIKNKTDFLLIAGDLFDVPLPDLQIINKTVETLKKLKDNNIKIYAIAGSHDFSYSNKTFLKTFEILELITLVDKNFYEDDNLFITGISGKKGGLDSKQYDNSNIDLTKNNRTNKLKIFMFHNNIKEITNLDFGGIQLKDLPKGFNYYAGGHIHTSFSKNNIVYPGALFPNNFKELKQINPQFYSLKYDFKNKNLTQNIEQIKLYEKIIIDITINEQTSEEVKLLIKNKIEKENLENKIILITLTGILDGKLKDINLSSLVDLCYEKKALIVLKSARKLKFKNLIIDEDLEKLDINKIFEKEFQKINTLISKTQDKKIIKQFLNSNFEKNEDETNLDYENRITKLYEKILEKNTTKKIKKDKKND